jgi:hypothetical protein
MLLRKKIYRFSLAAIVFACGGLFAASAALAQIPPIDPNADNLIVNFTPDPLFNAGNFLPGDSRTGEAEVINGTDETKRIATEAINFSTSGLFDSVPSDDLSRALTIVIREKNVGGDLYGGSSPVGAKTLCDFYEDGETYLSSVSGSSSKIYEFEISFPESKGDEWQGTTTKFDIIVGFQGEEGGIKYCNYNGKQDNGETGIDCGGGGCPACGGGGGGLPPGLIIKYENHIEVGENYVEIEWWTSYEATSQVVYSSEDEYNAGYKFDFSDNQYGGDPQFENPPKYGYKNTTYETNIPSNPNSPTKVTYRKITITGLQDNTTYHYRCVSHASPPTISRAHTFTTLALADGGDEDDDGGDETGEDNETDTGDTGDVGGAYSGIGGIVDAVSDFVSSVFEDEEEKEEEKREGEVAGTVDENGVEIGGEAEGETAIECGEYPEYLLWLIVLLLLIIIALLYYIYKNKKRKINNDLE